MSVAAVPLSKVRLLNQLRCSIFQTSYNPTSARTGAKYLRERLRGPSMVKYYPEKPNYTIAKLNRMYPEWDLVDTEEVIRLNDVEEKKARGKGAPKKAKSKAESRRAAKKR